MGMDVAIMGYAADVFIFVAPARPIESLTVLAGEESELVTSEFTAVPSSHSFCQFL